MDKLAKLAVSATTDIPPHGGAGQDVIDKFMIVFAWSKWIGLIIAVVGLLATGVLVIKMRQAGGELHIRKIDRVLKSIIIIGVVAALVGALLGYILRLRVSM